MISAHPRLLAAAALLIAALPLAACSDDPPPAPSSTEDPADILEGLEDEPGNAALEPVFPIPESCEDIDFTKIAEDHLPVTGGEVTDSSEPGKLQCGYLAMDDEFLTWGVNVLLNESDWLAEAGVTPAGPSPGGPYYESEGSVRYAGFAAYGDQFGTMYYFLPGLWLQVDSGLTNPAPLTQAELESVADDVAAAAAAL